MAFAVQKSWHYKSNLFNLLGLCDIEEKRIGRETWRYGESPLDSIARHEMMKLYVTFFECHHHRKIDKR